MKMLENPPMLLWSRKFVGAGLEVSASRSQPRQESAAARVFSRRVARSGTKWLLPDCAYVSGPERLVNGGGLIEVP